MVNRFKAVGDVRLDDPSPTPPGLIDQDLEGIVRAALGPEPEKARQHVRLEDRLEHDLQRRLHDAVTNRRNRQGPLLRRAGLGNEHPASRKRPPPAVLQLRGQLVEESGDPVLLDLPEIDRVDARSAVVATHRRPCTRQDIPAVDLVPQRVEPPSGIGLGRPVERMLQGTDRIRGRTSPDGGTSHAGTHRAPPLQQNASTKQRPFPHRRLCCPSGSSSTTAASDAHPAHFPFPGCTRL